MPKCTINGKQIEVKDGTTIIQAMYQEGQKIAHYCWHPGLSVAGVCRLCWVEIEGNPRPQIACNTQVTEGMVINNSCDKVKEAVKWGLDFHLINHPLDCPVCDQAGECGLQDQYMEYGLNNSKMSEKKVKKHKVVNLGDRVVLDSERCILCTRCVRFTNEVTKTDDLGLFNRGDRTEVGTFENRPFNNDYSLNTVDICPVGALTSKDFRFRQRVWYLKEAKTICTGCSTGCNVSTFFNKEGFFRVKPAYNEKINGYWMCDKGRDVYKFLNRPVRLLTAKKRNENGWQDLTAGGASKSLFEILKISNAVGTGVAVVLTGQYSNEEYDALIGKFKNNLNVQLFYHWQNNPESAHQFDGLLVRGDKNPNTLGLKNAFKKHNIPQAELLTDTTLWNDLVEKLNSGKITTLVVAAPENHTVYHDLKKNIALFAKAKNLIWLSACSHEEVANLKGSVWQIPMKTYVEKEGTWTNFAGMEQKVSKITTIVGDALTLTEFAALATGENYRLQYSQNFLIEDKRQQDSVMVEQRKRNEFTFKRNQV